LRETKCLDFNLKHLLKNIEEFVYDSKFFWTPELYVVNALASLEENRYKLRVVPKNRSFFEHAASRDVDDLKDPRLFTDHLTVLVSQVRKIRGVFHETLELNEFPTDKQELSVTVSSARPIDQVLLVQDMSKDNLINTDRFYDDSSWDLFQFCKYSNRECRDSFTGVVRSESSFTGFVVRKYQSYLYK
jgi:hypothetical protein